MISSAYHSGECRNTPAREAPKPQKPPRRELREPENQDHKETQGLLQTAGSKEAIIPYYGCTLGVSAGQKTDWTIGECDNLP